MALGDIVTQLGGAAASLFEGKGNAAQARDFQGAETLATQNAQLAAASTRIQETQVSRSVTQSLGTTQADIASAGFTMSGSALDLLKSSAQQGALAKSLVNIQGAINENSYAAQAGAYAGEAKAANEASEAGKISAIASVGGALINGVGSLASAGQTIAKGYNYITGLFTGSSGVASQVTSDFAIPGISSTFDGIAGAADSIPGFGASSAAADFSIPGLSPDLALSSTDFSIGSGAAFSDALATTDIGVDTSLIPLGTTSDIASSAISDAVTSGLSDAVSVLPYVGLAASIYEDITHPSVGSFLSTAATVAAIAFCVICTAFYRRDMVPRRVWLGAQRYGQELDPMTFNGYLYWASPIARRINESERFAKVLAPIFIPPVNEMAAIMGQNVKRTIYGFVSHRVLLGLSWLVGRTLARGGQYAYGRTH